MSTDTATQPIATVVDPKQLPILEGTVIDVVLSQDDDVEVIERFIRVEPTGDDEAACWMSTADGIRWEVTPANRWWIVAVPLPAVAVGIVEEITQHAALRPPVLDTVRDAIAAAILNIGRTRG